MNLIKKYALKYWYIYAAGFGLMLAGIGLDMINPIATGRIIDEVIVANDRTNFVSLILILLGITVGRAIAGYLKEIMFDSAGAKIMVQIRLRLFQHIQSLSYDFFEQRNTGELMSRIKDDVMNIWNGTSFGIMLVIESFIYLVLSVFFMVRISLGLSLIVLAILPILGFIAYKLEASVGATYEKISDENAELSTIAQENIAGVRLVKAFAREKYEISKFLSRNKSYYQLNYDQAVIWSRFYPKIEFISYVLPVMVVTIGGYFVIGEQLSIGTLVEFLGYTYMAVWPMRIIGWLSNVMAEMSASVRKIDTVFAHQTKVDLNPQGVKKDDIKGKIEFEAVGLSLNDSQVLEDVSFCLEPKQTLGIMGTTGSGKSSIINLLTRFYDNTTGTIRIDGIPIQDYELKNLRRHISVVLQDVFLFSNTIKDNILFGTDEPVFVEADNEETDCIDQVNQVQRAETVDSEEIRLVSNKIIDAAKIAQAHDFVSGMDRNYDTVIGENGIGLSGGQKQRISIARAIAKNARIIVFDDSTSALDMETEHRIQKELEALSDVTKIIIGHRISSVKHADQILILDQGKIVERGTHQQLIDQKGLYYQTYVEQYDGYMEM